MTYLRTVCNDRTLKRNRVWRDFPLNVRLKYPANMVVRDGAETENITADTDSHWPNTVTSGGHILTFNKGRHENAFSTN